MTYITVTEYPTNYGTRRDRKIDLARFAADLARELGAPPPELENCYATIKIGSELLTLHANEWKGHVHAGINAPDVAHDDRNFYAKEHRTASANVNPDGRSIAAIAKDIKRRVIVASAPALKAMREYAAKMRAERASLASIVAELKTLPAIDVRHNERERRAAIWSRGPGKSFDAELTYNGRIDIKRLPDLSVDEFRRVLAVLAKTADPT